jgi:predicted transposase/invertase (TIGR01784 family)
MKRDSIFFRLFQQSPTLLFELLPEAPRNANRYRFDSVAVKEPKFEIDGVFLPPDDQPGVVYYTEFQSQRDEELYERMTSESSNHFYRNRKRFSDWQAVAIYTSRSKEQKDVYPFRSLLNSDQFHRIYLNELGDARNLPLGLALMALTVEKPKKAKETAQYLADRVQKEVADRQTNRAIMEILTTIVVYTFNNLSRIEVEKMLGVDITLQETRFYKDVKAEGEEQGQRSIVSDLLNHKFGELSDRMIYQIDALSIQRVRLLSKALFDFSTIVDLETWLAQQSES